MMGGDVVAASQHLRAGKMLILVDAEDRENEGDLVIAAEKVTPEAINFMAQYGRGLICLALAPALVKKLQLPLMTQQNGSQFKTNFTVSIEAKTGVTTGISAYDRAHTILTAIAKQATADDLVMPGHVFPLLAEELGVVRRPGQTEGSVDLARLAGLTPAAVICEIMAPDGTMARMPALREFATQHGIPIVSIASLIKYRLRHDKSLISKGSVAQLPTKHGIFKIIPYTSLVDDKVHIALVHGAITANVPTLVRIHSECLTGDVFGSARCDCGNQLELALQKIAAAPSGVLLYLRQEGRGIGLAPKIQAYTLQDQGYDTVEANLQLGFPDDLREYGIGAQILEDLGVQRLNLLTNNPRKLQALQGSGLEIVAQLPLEVACTQDNERYLVTKKTKLGHMLKNIKG